ncbi:MAG: hypothetical protein Ct9H300mP29_5220 [Candidatus Neomarinimicrobiota bacterium]|nr:MAG: hypothetical protein Ct9H300mP29_5220 [Candidatus Neomarinimicrobiota bacterium]
MHQRKSSGNGLNSIFSTFLKTCLLIAHKFLIHPFPLHKRHFNINLGKLGLAIGPEILIAKTFYYLEIAIKPPQSLGFVYTFAVTAAVHSFSPFESTWPQIVPCPSGFDFIKRCLNFKKFYSDKKKRIFRVSIMRD